MKFSVSRFLFRRGLDAFFIYSFAVLLCLPEPLNRFTVFNWCDYSVTFVVPQAFKTQDGYILVGAGNDGLFRKLCKVR